MNLFYDLHHIARTGGLIEETREANKRANNAEQLHAKLLQRHEKLELVCQALVEIVQDRLQVTDKQLEEKILEVDMRDGKADGKLGAKVAQCRTCGRNVNSERPVCIFCGTKASTSDLS